VLLVTILFILLTLVPYGLGYLTALPDSLFTGLIMNPEDAQTYWAKMVQGFNGAWFYTIPFTPEPHEPAMVGVFYVWLGQLARGLGLSITAVWHLSRSFSTLILCLTTFGFVSAFTPNKQTRWTAYLLALFGSGLGWILFILRQTYWLNAFPIDFKQPGAHIFFTAMTFPHITIGTACILVSIWSLKSLTINNQQSTINRQPLTSQFTIHNSLLIILLANVSNAILAIAYPFLTYLIIGTAVLLWLSLTIPKRTILWQTGFKLAATMILPAPLFIYYAYVLQTNDIFRLWDIQAGTPSPPWPHYLVAFGPYLLLAIIFWWKRPSQRPTYTTLWMWIILVALLLYAPLRPQRRFVQGIHVPLSILAAMSVQQVVIPTLTQTKIWQRIAALPRYTTPKMVRLLLMIFLLVMSISNLYLWADVIRTAVIIQPDPLFRPVDEADAIDWLREASKETAVTIGSYQTGNYIASQTGMPVMLGHWAETAHIEEKTAVVAQFYANDTDDTWRQEIIKQYNINYVWFGSREKALGNFQPETKSYLDSIYKNETITIYEVQQSGR
ncbi:MAG: hypothetical protein GY943_03440, partial [Chloroflexi bacterium]|nr:hypothetical protein [Chloroflexota bacterium]